MLTITSEVEIGVRARSVHREPRTVKWIESMSSGDILWDVGANVGAYSLIAARLHEGRVLVFAFEPGYENYRTLCANLFLNDCSPPITPLPIALSHKTQLSLFHFRDVRSGSALHKLDSDSVPKSLSEDVFQYAQPVMTITAEDVVKNFSIPEPTHVKIDTDGGELDVLAGATNMLKKPSVGSLLIEIEENEGPELERAIVKLLESYGFVEDDPVARRGSIDSRNFIFEKRR